MRACGCLTMKRSTWTGWRSWASTTITPPPPSALARCSSAPASIARCRAFSSSTRQTNWRSRRRLGFLCSFQAIPTGDSFFLGPGSPALFTTSSSTVCKSSATCSSTPRAAPVPGARRCALARAPRLFSFSSSEFHCSQDSRRRLNGQVDRHDAARFARAVCKLKPTVVGFGDLPRKHQTDAASLALGGIERHERIPRILEPCPVVSDGQHQTIGASFPLNRTLGIGPSPSHSRGPVLALRARFKHGVRRVVQQIDQHLLKLIGIRQERHVGGGAYRDFG